MRLHARSACRVLLLLACPLIARAQATSSSSPKSEQPFDSNGKPLTFDTVSIHLNKAPMGPETAKFDWPANGDGIRLQDIVLSSIVGSFYGFNQDSQSGMPGWADSECYDIRAKVADSDLPVYHTLTKAQRSRMAQLILEDRFKLKVHTETKEAPVYELGLAKDGAKLKEATPGEVYTSGPKGPDGQGVSGTIYVSGEGELTAHALDMRAFARSLKSLAGRQVEDKTGLTGKYDFVFKWSPRPNDPDAPSIFTALEEQLGLKLKSSRGPVQVLVVDHIERPSEN